jgi:hypothetical protein
MKLEGGAGIAVADALGILATCFSQYVSHFK